MHEVKVLICLHSAAEETEAEEVNQSETETKVSNLSIQESLCKVLIHRFPSKSYKFCIFIMSFSNHLEATLSYKLMATLLWTKL